MYMQAERGIRITGRRTGWRGSIEFEQAFVGAIGCTAETGACITTCEVRRERLLRRELSL
jgi:hypothetical protein